MRIVYMGTPEFALLPLETLIKAGHEIIGVFTQPDKPKGRGMKMIASPVKQLALSQGIPVYQPETFKDHAVKPLIDELKPDLIAVVAYGKMLPLYVRKAPKFGCINIHGSLLPKYRGAAPMQRAVMNGEPYTGVSIMHLVKEMDAGDVILSDKIEIGEYETYGEIAIRLSKLGAELLIKAIDMIKSGTATRTPQNTGDVTYAAMITREDLRINWSDKARTICDQIRGLSPAPGAYTVLNGQNYKIFSTKVCESDINAEPGTILGTNEDRNIIVKCGDRAVSISEIQAPGGRKMSVRDYIRGHKLPERFE